VVDGIPRVSAPIMPEDQETSMKQKTMRLRARVSVWLGALTAALLSSVPIAAGASEAYPSKPVSMIVAYPPGGSTDLSTRIIAEKLSQILGQPFVVVNRPGAAGNIGTAQLAKAAPDGYTLGHGYVGTISIHPALYGAKLPYDPEKDLVGVAPVASVPTFLVTPPSLGVRSVAELVALAKSKPGQLTFGTAGNGSTQHLFAELFNASAGIEARHIPFSGSGPANVALLGGHISFMFDAGQVVQQVRLGQLTGLATTAGNRLSSIPEMPTVAESYAGFEATSWHGIFAPAGTPRPIVELLNGKIREILTLPDVHRRLAAAQMSVVSMSPAEFAAFIRDETSKWSKVIRATGVRIE